MIIRWTVHVARMGAQRVLFGENYRRGIIWKTLVNITTNLNNRLIRMD
jgi:hypothetical protein